MDSVVLPITLLVQLFGTVASSAKYLIVLGLIALKMSRVSSAILACVKSTWVRT